MQLLLHVCCGPDVTIALERLSDIDALRLYFDNPNIHPLTEYQKRTDALITVANHYGATLMIGAYETEKWVSLVKGYEKEPEGGERCKICISERLRRTAKQALEIGFDTIGSVFSTSPHKNAEWINAEGDRLSSEMGLAYFATNFKKQDGFKRSVRLSRELGIYRQNYCGCEYSFRS